MSRVLGGYRGRPQAGARRPTPPSARPPTRPHNPPEPEGDLVGVVWGEGEGPVNQRGQVVGAGISAWIGRLIRTVWRRYFSAGLR